MRLLDGDRLMADLRKAADEVVGSLRDDRWFVGDHLEGMCRAWRVVAAAIEDGEYDVPTSMPDVARDPVD